MNKIAAGALAAFFFGALCPNPRPAAEAGQARPSAPPAAGISRVDFAAAYLRFEKAFMAAKLDAEETARINREFDALTLVFFSGKFGPGIQKLNELTASFAPGAAAAETRNAEAALSVRKSLDAARAGNTTRLSGLRIDPSAGPFAQALASVKARNELLADTPSPNGTAQAVLDLAKLADDVGAEIDALAAGKNPFKGRLGDVWRVVAIPGRTVPVRVFVPDAAKAGRPLPVVVALHGAGGDENMFMDGYGAGLLKKLAAKKGFIAAAPFTNAFIGADGPALLDALVEMLGAEQPIDKRRVYVLGHSMGGMTAGRLAVDKAGLIAAAACMCGFNGIPAGTAKVPPLLVLAAELDPIVPAARIEPAAKKAAEAGFPVEYRLVPGFGHTLVVSRELPAVIDWLLRHAFPMI